MRFFKFPTFMRKKQKLQAMEGLIDILNESSKKTNCEICGYKYKENSSRWSNLDLGFGSSICILCHKDTVVKDGFSYYNEEQTKELKKLTDK